MIPETFLIAGSAASVGFIHTILGPDHYLPLVAMAEKQMVGADQRLQATLLFVVLVMFLEPSLLVHWFFFLGLAFFNIETVQSITVSLQGVFFFYCLVQFILHGV